MPMRRISGATVRLGLDRTSPSTRISPASRSSKPITARSVVVLPQPEGPSKEAICPDFTSNEMSSSTASRL